MIKSNSLNFVWRVRDAMELYQIGRFLDLDILAQNCEDAIVQVRVVFTWLMDGLFRRCHCPGPVGFYVISYLWGCLVQVKLVFTWLIHCFACEDVIVQVILAFTWLIDFFSFEGNIIHNVQVYLGWHDWLINFAFEDIIVHCSVAATDPGSDYLLPPWSGIRIQDEFIRDPDPGLICCLLSSMPLSSVSGSYLVIHDWFVVGWLASDNVLSTVSRSSWFWLRDWLAWTIGRSLSISNYSPYAYFIAFDV
jgi:hypothetical protein